MWLRQLVTIVNCFHCTLRVPTWQSVAAFSGDILNLFELFYGISTRKQLHRNATKTTHLEYKCYCATVGAYIYV